VAGERILIVEDEGLVALALKQCLTSLGYNIAGIAAAGEEAIRITSVEKPDLILMDIRLKGDTDGIDLAYWIRHTFRIPVVFLTAHSDEKTLERAKIAEPFGYIIKPFDENILRSNIEMALFKASMEIELSRTKKKLSAILRSLQEGIILCNRNGKVDYLNLAALRMIGIPKVQVKKKNIFDLLNLFDHKTHEKIELPLEEVFSSKNRVSIETVIVQSDGLEERLAQISVVPILNETDDVTGIVLAICEKTALKPSLTSQ